MKKSELIDAITSAEEEMSAGVTENSSNEEVAVEESSNCEEVSESTDEAVESESSAIDSADVNDTEESDNGWKEIARNQITHAYNWIVGENENTLEDCPEDSEEYKASYNFLHSKEEIADYIYKSAITTEYDEGYCGGQAPKEMRFAGKDFCRNVIIDLLKKDGYYKEEEQLPSLKEVFEDIDHTFSETSNELTSDSEDPYYEENKESAKPIIKKLRTNTKYTCPVCGGSAKNKYDFCYKCGILLNHDSKRYDDFAKKVRLNNSEAPKKKVIRVGKTRKCPSCSKKIWAGDNFCSYCGQEVEDNA